MSNPMIPPTDAGSVSEVEQRAKEWLTLDGQITARPCRLWSLDPATADDDEPLCETCRFGQADHIITDLLALVAELRQQQEQMKGAIDGWQEPAAASSKLWRERLEAAEASLTALRREQEQLQQEMTAIRRARIADSEIIGMWRCRAEQAEQQLQAAEATGEAAVSRIAELNERIERDAEEFEALANRSREVTEGLRQHLADRAAAIAQIVQEMRASKWRPASDFLGDGGLADQWADRLDAVGAERTTQGIEEKNKT